MNAAQAQAFFAQLQADFRRTIARCTDIAKNDNDTLGDGDQSPLRIIPDRGPAADLWRAWSDGGDFSGFCSFRIMPPFHAACFTGSAGAVRQFLEQARRGPPGALPALLESRLGLMRLTPLHTAVAGARTVGTPYAATVGMPPSGTDHVSVVEQLIQAGARLDPRDVIGASPVHYCSSVAGTPLTWGTILPMLARAGADVNARNRFGQTALMEPSQLGNVEAARVLIKDLGADPHLRCNANMSLLDGLSACRDKRRVKEFRELIEAATKKAAKATPAAVVSSALAGQRVKLRGLVARPELNGRQGIAEAVDDASGRLVVRLLPAGGGAGEASSSGDAAAAAAAADDKAERVRVKRENFALVGVDTCAGCGAACRAEGQKKSEGPAWLRTCSACLFSKYCSAECQKAHWRAHKAECAALQAACLAVLAPGEGLLEEGKSFAPSPWNSAVKPSPAKTDAPLVETAKFLSEITLEDGTQYVVETPARGPAGAPKGEAAGSSGAADAATSSEKQSKFIVKAQLSIKMTPDHSNTSVSVQIDPAGEILIYNEDRSVQRRLLPSNPAHAAMVATIQEVGFSGAIPGADQASSEVRAKAYFQAIVRKDGALAVQFATALPRQTW